VPGTGWTVLSTAEGRVVDSEPPCRPDWSQKSDGSGSGRTWLDTVLPGYKGDKKIFIFTTIKTSSMVHLDTLLQYHEHMYCVWLQTCSA